MTFEELKGKADRSCDSSGGSCRYYKINDQFGLKTYSYRCDAVESQRNQRWMSQHGLAPYVYSGVRKHDVSDGKPVYYFVTEHLPTTCYQWRWDGEHKEEFARQLKNFRRKCSRRGMSICDTCDFNFGLRADGTFMMLDCGSETIPNAIERAYIKTKTLVKGALGA